MSDLETLSRLSIDAKDAAKRMYSASESLERYMIKNNKYLSRVLPDLKKIKKGLETTTKVATEVKQALPDLKKISKTAKETADKAKQVADTAKQVGGKAKEVTDLLEKGDFGKVNKNLSKGVSGGAVAIGLAGGALVVGTIAVKLQEDINNIAFSQLEQTGKELGTQLNIIVKHDASLKSHEKRLDALSSDYDVLAGYQGNLTQRLNKNEHDFLFLKQEINQQLNTLNEVIRISNINTYNNDLKLQNQILELAEKIKNIKLGTNDNTLILDLINARLSVINESIAKNERLNQTERDSIKKEIKSLSDKIPINNQTNNNQGNNNFNPAEIWTAINTNKNYTITALNNSKKASDQLKLIKINDSKQNKRLELLEKDLPLIKINDSKQNKQLKLLEKDLPLKFEAITQKQWEQQKKNNNIQQIEINKEKNERILNDKQISLKLKKESTKTDEIATKLSELGSGLFRFKDDLNSNELPLLKKEISILKNKQGDNEKLNQEGLDILKNILPALYLIPAKTAATIKTSIPTIPEIEIAAAAGTCKTFQPGGCSITNLNNFANDIKTNNNTGNAGLWNKINAGLNGANLAGSAAQMAILNQIDGKLGPKLPNGGLSGFLQNFLKRFDDFAKWMHLDRVLNILIWWQTLHNASMLSQNIAQTLASGINNITSLLGLKDSEGKPFDMSSVIGKAYSDLLKAALGEETYKNLNTQWNKYNRIYQAATNMLNSLQSMYHSIFGALNTIGSWNAKVGNALKKWGVVAEKAYEWFNPAPNFNNKFFNALEAGQQVADAFDQITSEGVSIQQNIKEFSEQKAELDKVLGQTTNTKQANPTPEASKVKENEDKSKASSKSPLITDSDKIKPE